MVLTVEDSIILEPFSLCFEGAAFFVFVCPTGCLPLATAIRKTCCEETTSAVWGHDKAVQEELVRTHRHREARRVLMRMYSTEVLPRNRYVSSTQARSQGLPRSLRRVTVRQSATMWLPKWSRPSSRFDGILSSFGPDHWRHYPPTNLAMAVRESHTHHFFTR